MLFQAAIFGVICYTVINNNIRGGSKGVRERSESKRLYIMKENNHKMLVCSIPEILHKIS